jgi:hypothetical protein
MLMAANGLFGSDVSAETQLNKNNGLGIEFLPN